MKSATATTNVEVNVYCPHCNTIQDILFTHTDQVREEFNYSRSNIKLTKEDAVEIYKRILLGEHNKSIAKDYKISPSTVTDIKKGRRWAKFTGATSNIKILNESNIPQI